MGAGRGVQGGALAPPWNLKMMTSYAVFKQNILKNFARACRSRIITPIFCSNLWKICKKIAILTSAQNMTSCLLASKPLENVGYVQKIFGMCTPLGKSVCTPLLQSRYATMHPPENHPVGAHDNSLYDLTNYLKQRLKIPTNQISYFGRKAEYIFRLV